MKIKTKFIEHVYKIRKRKGCSPEQFEVLIKVQSWAPTWIKEAFLEDELKQKLRLYYEKLSLDK